MTTIKKDDNQDDLEMKTVIPVLATTVVVEDKPDPPDADDLGFDPEADSMVTFTFKNDTQLERNTASLKQHHEEENDAGKEQTESKETNNTTHSNETYNHTTKNDNTENRDAAANTNDTKEKAEKDEFDTENTRDAAANTNNDELLLEKDTYTLLLVTTSWRRPSFWFALFICFQQVGLLYAILTQQFDTGREKRTTWNVPFSNSSSVQFGQFVAIIFSLFTQRDLLQNIPIFVAFIQKEDNWKKLLPMKKNVNSNDEEESVVGLIASEEEEQDKSKYFWWRKVFATYLLNMGVSLLTLFTSFVVIVQSTDIIELVKDFTALYIIAQLDDFAYKVIHDGYFGNIFEEEVKRSKEFRVKRSDSQVIICNKKIRTQSLIVLTLFFVMLGTWSMFVSKQNSGVIFHEIYKDCDAFAKSYRGLQKSLSYTQWGDGTCDPRLFTEECGFDGGDCSDECTTFFQFTVLPNLEDNSYEDYFYSDVIWKELGSDCFYYDDDCSDAKLEKILTCLDELYYGNITEYEGMSKCLSDETIYDSESDDYLYCWFGAEAIIDPKKKKEDTGNSKLRMILPHEKKEDAPLHKQH